MREAGLRDGPMLQPLPAVSVAAALAVCLAAVGCGASSGPWGTDPMLVDTWSQTGLTEDGAPADFAPTMLTFRGDGTWRADSADGGWCTGGYRTREGRLNYWIDASDDPAKVGSGYTFSYAASANTLVLRGRLSGHDRVATFARLQ